MVHVVKSADSEVGGLFISAVDSVCLSESGNHERVAFDCEGVNLSRIGTLEIISVCFSPGELFIVEIGQNPDAEILKSVKQLFEESNVTKIIHDCRMDSDALFHLHGIKLNNVHDTSSYHSVITGHDDENLNNVLLMNGVRQNETRDKSVYRSNPSFWSTRPLTKQMIEWASSDVDRLFEVALKQLSSLDNNEGKKNFAMRKSNENIEFAREKNVIKGLSVRRPGPFIGKRGSNLRSLQRRTNTLVYQQRPLNTWFVYYNDENDLNVVQRAMRN